MVSSSETPAVDSPKGLTFRARIFILAALIALFLLANGPLWRHAWNMDAVDSAIYWSYAPIPLLVGGWLLATRRFSWGFFLFETIAITLVKYAITFSIALFLWSQSEPPPHESHVPIVPPVPEAPAPPVTPIDPSRTGAIVGTVTRADGTPAANALVWVAEGLEAYVFARPTEALRIEHDGAAIVPALVVARAGQPIEARSTDGHLHTLVATGQGGGVTFNVPLPRAQTWTRIVLREPADLSTLSCSVHPNVDRPARIVVLDHPFFARTGADGAFRITGVPAGDLAVRATAEGAGVRAERVTIGPLGEQRLTIALENTP